jgi:hypothetical protein
MNERERETLLDQSLAATFPASDPLSVTQPGGGVERWPNRPAALDRLVRAAGPMDATEVASRRASAGLRAPIRRAS